MLLFAIFRSYFCRQVWNVGHAHVAWMLESLERSKHGSEAEGSLSTSVQDDATDWSNFRERCGGWLKLRHRTEFGVIGWCCVEVENRNIAISWRVWLEHAHVSNEILGHFAGSTGSVWVSFWRSPSTLSRGLYLFLLYCQYRESLFTWVGRT